MSQFEQTARELAKLLKKVDDSPDQAVLHEALKAVGRAEAAEAEVLHYQTVLNLK